MRIFIQSAKTLIIALLLLLTISCNKDDDEPSRLTLDRQFAEAAVEAGETFATGFTVGAQLTTADININPDLVDLRDKALNKVEYFEAMQETIDTGFEQALNRLSQQTGETFDRQPTRQACKNNLKQIGIGLHSFEEGAFVDALKTTVDTATTAKDHKEWSTLLSLGSYNPATARDLNGRGTIEGDWARTQMVFETSVKPFLSSTHTSQEIIDLVSDIAGEDHKAEALIAAFLLPSKGRSSIENLTLTYGKMSMNHLLKMDHTEEAVAATFPDVAEVMFYGFVFASYYPEPSCNGDANCAMVAVLEGMYYATMYYQMSQLWEYTALNRKLNAERLISDGSFYGSAYAGMLSQTGDAIKNNPTLSGAIRNASTKADFVAALDQDVELCIGIVCPELTDWLFGSSDEESEIVGQITDFARETILQRMDYDDDGDLDLFVTNSPGGDNAMVWKPTKVVVSSYSLSEGSSQNPQPDLTSLRSTFDNLDYTVLKETANLRALLQERIANDQLTEAFFLGLLVPTLTETNTHLRPIMESLIGYKLGSIPAEFQGFYDSQTVFANRAAINGGFYAFFHGQTYPCQTMECELANITYEMYLASLYYMLHATYEFIENYQNAKLVNTLWAEGDRFGSMIGEALNASIGVLNDINTAPTIIANSETFHDFLLNVQPLTASFFPNEITELNATANCQFPAPGRTSIIIDEMVNSGTILPDIEEDLPAIVASLAADASPNSVWLQALLQKTLKSDDSKPFMDSPVRDFERMTSFFQALGTGSLATDADYEMIREGLIDSLDLKTNPADPAAIALLLPAVQAAREAVRGASRATDIVGFLEIVFGLGNVPLDVYQSIESWDEELDDVLFHATLYAFYKEEAFSCNANVDCIYSNLYNEMYLIAQYYYLGQIWKYIEANQV